MDYVLLAVLGILVAGIGSVLTGVLLGVIAAAAVNVYRWLT